MTRRERTQLPNCILACQASLGYMLGHVLFILGTRQLLLLCTFYATCLSRSSSASLGLLRVPQHNTCCYCPSFPSPSHSPLKYLSNNLLVHPPDSTVKVISWLKWMYTYQETFRKWKYFWFVDSFKLYHNTLTYYAHLIVLILLERYVLVQGTIILSKIYHLNIWHKINFSFHLNPIGRIKILLELN